MSLFVSGGETVSRRTAALVRVIGAFVVLVFLITVAKLQAGVLERPL